MSEQSPIQQRLDQLVLARGLVASRSRARDAIQRGTVKVDGNVVTKPSLTFAVDVELSIDDPAQDYVSRAALKLVAALDHFKLDPAGHDCLDVGASAGGFTEVLLQRGCAPARLSSCFDSFLSKRYTTTSALESEQRGRSVKARYAGFRPNAASQEFHAAILLQARGARM